MLLSKKIRMASLLPSSSSVAKAQVDFAWLMYGLKPVPFNAKPVPFEAQSFKQVLSQTGSISNGF
jgi:hypothetical protein